MSLMQLLVTSRSINAAKDGPTRYKMAEQNLLPKFLPRRRGATTAPLEASESSAATPAKEPTRALQLETASLFDFNPNSEIAVATPSGSTGHWPVPSGAPPLGMGKSPDVFRASVTSANLLPVPSGQWPDGTGGSPVPPIPTSEFGFNPRSSKAAQKTALPAVSMATTRSPAMVEPARMEGESAVTVAKKILPEASNPFVTAPESKSKKSRWSLFETWFVRRREKHRNGELVQGEWVLDQVTVVRNDLSDADLEVVVGKAPVREASAAQVSKREMMTQALARFTTRFQRMEREETGGGTEAGVAGTEMKYPEMAVRS